ncbi:MAG: Hint domain-containing protein [Pseudomonadota bacterium]|nr:Hint domain-containing protein [Pseudomonadota bacterium]
MPVEQTLVWSDLSANGDFTLGSGTEAVNVSIISDTNADGDAASVRTLGVPETEALWVRNIDNPVTTEIAFETPVQDVSFTLIDVDNFGPVWDDQVTILATDADGNIYPVSFSDLEISHDVDGNTIEGNSTTTIANDNFGTDSGADINGADSVTVTIPGPVTSIVIIFEPGADADRTGFIGVSDITLTNAPDGIVEGTAAGDLIDGTYLDDPDGDRVEDDGVVIRAGDGDDTIVGGDGDDNVDGGIGNDEAELGQGNDTFKGGEGDDRVNGDYGNDVLDGGEGNDWLRGSFGNDTIHAGEGDDYLWGGFGDDTFVVTNGFGNDTIEGEDQDEINGDTLDLSAVTDDLTIDLSGSDTKSGTFSDGTDTTSFGAIENIKLSAGQDTLVLADGSGADRVSGFQAPTDNGDGTYAAGDLLDVTGLTFDYGARGVTTRDVTITEDGDGNAVLTFPGGENLTLEGVSASDISDPAALEAMGIPEAPDGYVTGTDTSETMAVGYLDDDGDFIDGGDAALAGASGDDDHILALGGNDTVHAGAGNDLVDGGSGDDVMFGDLGDDTLIGGTGADEMYGGADNDTFIGITAGDSIFGEDGLDTLNLSGVGDHNIVVDADDTSSGTIEFLDADGNVTGTAAYKDIETIVPCFTPGTRIATKAGFTPVEDLAVGDLVCTRDHGLQEIRWVGKRDMSAQDLAERPHLRGVKIEKHALGENLPDQDMIVSPNHRVLVNDHKVELLLGEREVLVAAKHLLGMPGVTRDNAHALTYIHFMFDRHEIVYSDQLWSESFQPGQQALNGLEEAQRIEIFELFPELESDRKNVFGTARRVAQKHEAKLITR